LVRASSHRRDGLVFSHPFEGKDLDDLTEAAAYFTGERLLDAGWTTPSWLIWSSNDGSALRAYQKVMLGKQSPQPYFDEAESDNPCSVEDRRRLQYAVAASPGTGAALVALSNEAVLAGDLAAALHLLLLARIRHPHFLTARYRLGVTLSMVATDVDAHLPDLDPGSLTSRKALNGANNVAGAIDVLTDLRDRKRGKHETRIDWPSMSSTDRQKVLLRTAREELDYVIVSVKLKSTIRNACRQTERSYWLRLTKSSRSRRALGAAAKSARALALRRRYLLATPLALRVDSPTRPYEPWQRVCQQLDAEMENAVRSVPDDWIVRYNASCYSAQRADEQRRLAEFHKTRGTTAKTDAANKNAHRLYLEAYDHLRRARYARNGHQLSPKWVDADPDLKPLKEWTGKRKWRLQLASLFNMSNKQLNQLLDC